MSNANGLVNRIKIGLGIVLVASLTGCAGYVDGGYGGGYGDYGDYGYDGGGSDIYLFSGGYDRGRDVRAYSHRGSESRGAAHFSGAGGGGHSGGGGHGGGGGHR